MDIGKRLKVLAIIVAVVTAIVTLLAVENGPVLIVVGMGAAVVASVGYNYSTPAAPKMLEGIVKHLLLSAPVALIMVAAGYPFDLHSTQVFVQQFAGMVVILLVPAEVLERKLLGAAK